MSVCEQKMQKTNKQINQKTKLKKSKANFTDRKVYYFNISKGATFLLQGILETEKNNYKPNPLLQDLVLLFCRSGPYKQSQLLVLAV